MPPRKDPDASASVPAFFGAELRFKREEQGLTLQEFADGCFYSVAFISQIEMGERRMPPAIARYADQRLDTDGFFVRRLKDARKAARAGHAEYFADVAEMEKRAETIEESDPLLIPGLLQTEEYARRLVRASHPRASRQSVDEKVAARMSRAKLFERPNPPDFWAILDEMVIRRAVLPPEQMADLLDHITTVIRSIDGVLQFLPCNASVHPLLMSPTRLMTFPDAPPLVYTESLYSGQLIDEPVLVKQFRKSYDLLRAAALSPEASLALISAAAEDFRDDRQRE
ncbi:helix-turn-helix domain-containing protein [Streptomyces boncukensis]|uniref:Helix-turn-helix domain-containing protein n=1 Tax=Streptomyces boncukensis TaxID=2711219 RepID=A0A6G4WUI6_9ACTN|nr:helix-turn-helix transcriptional regulator [Streptomyces boncukensis]NGO68663.1 helix-turn-helix domain-containing protein [Streptomyces boncukensis]